MIDNKQRVLDTVNAGTGINWQIAEALSIKESTVSTLLCALVKEGKIIRVRRGHYKAVEVVKVEKGITFLDLLKGKWFR